ncbi:MAG: LPS assembly protein LptD [Terracidiphilus sp.]
MRPRTFVLITTLALCHLQLRAQALTNAAPQPPAAVAEQQPAPLPDEPGLQVLPLAQPEPIPPAGVPVDWDARSQGWAGDTVTLSGDVVFHYRGYTLHADRVVYHRASTELEAEGNLQLLGGPEDIFVEASHGEMRLNMHTARFYDVHGSLGVRHNARAVVYSTPNPFLFSGRVLLQTGEGSYRIVDGSMTNCRLPRPDWQLIAHSIQVANGKASTTNTVFKFLGVPLFYLPYLRHPVDDTGRESGLLIPVVSTGSSIRGSTFGEQVYIVLSRNMDMIVGSEFYSRRGWAPNGDFRYKGPGLDHLTARWNALLDRGAATTPPSGVRINQGGVDISALGRKDLGPNTRLAGNVEFLSSYLYRLVFNDNYFQAVSSEVASTVSLTHNRNGLLSSGSLERFQSFAGSANGDEVRIIHLPNLRFDLLDRPLANSPAYFGFGSSAGYLTRAEPGFHARNIGRFDLYPHLSLPIVADGWSIVPEAAVRDTFYSAYQIPDLTGIDKGTPTIVHDTLNRSYAEAAVDIRPPAIERDFTLPGGNRTLRHVIEPEISWRFAGGIGSQARKVMLLDTTDIATDTDEVAVSLTQRFFLRPIHAQPCAAGEDGVTPTGCQRPREWAAWQVAQKFFIDDDFGDALIPNRRNVFASTLDQSGIAYLTAPRNLAPVISRLRFEAIENLRIQWDLDYDPRAGRIGANNIFAGYSWGRTTFGLGHNMLNAVDETGSKASIIQSQQLQPFLQIGKPSGRGFNLAANGSYDFVLHEVQYAGVQTTYNWNCCGITLGYRRFTLGSLRDETQFLYSFTLANFGSVGDIRRSNNVFRDPNLPPAY